MWQVAEAESSEQQWQRRGDDSAAQPSHSLSVLNSVGGGIVVVGWGGVCVVFSVAGQKQQTISR
jgi:hypothetical protein